jgi:hypothetical protein
MSQRRHAFVLIAIASIEIKRSRGGRRWLVRNGLVGIGHGAAVCRDRVVGREVLDIHTEDGGLERLVMEASAVQGGGRVDQGLSCLCFDAVAYQYRFWVDANGA